MKKRFKLGVFTLMVIALIGYNLEVLQVDLEGYLNGALNIILLSLIYKYLIKEEI